MVPSVTSVGLFLGTLWLRILVTVWPVSTRNLEQAAQAGKLLAWQAQGTQED